MSNFIAIPVISGASAILEEVLITVEDRYPLAETTVILPLLLRTETPGMYRLLMEYVINRTGTD